MIERIRQFDSYLSPVNAEKKLRRKSKHIILLAVTLVGLHSLVTADLANAQTIPVGDIREDQLRLQMLLNDTLATSYVNRPVWMNVYDTYMDAAAGRPGWWNRKLTTREELLEDNFRLGFFEPVIDNTYNSAIPIGENNGAAWYGRGLTTDVNSGAYLTSDYLTIVFRPQIVYQQNSDFQAPRFVPRNGNGEPLYQAEGIPTRYDAPYRFGPDSYWTTDPGHSSIRLHFGKIEMGVSTEPLWWGGAEKYPLVFSNNAAGIPHSFIGTRSPVRIPYLGNLEFKWLIARPQHSKYFDISIDVGQKRYVNAVNIAFSPALIPNLTLGLTRNYLLQLSNLRLRNITVVFDPFQKSQLTQDREFENQSISLYLRWLFPDAHAEIFAEYYREDHSYDSRDFLMQPMHNSAYAFGFQKLFFTPRSVIDFVKLHLEVTNLSPPRLDEIRFQTYFYTHSQIRQGATSKGEVWGAAIGPGSNSVYLAADGYSGDFKAGVFVQRVVDNEHFHYRWNIQRSDRPRGQGDKWNHRVNLNIGTNLLWGPGPFFVTGKVMWTKAFNYGRFQYGRTTGWDWDDRIFDDVENLQFQLGFRYAF